MSKDFDLPNAFVKTPVEVGQMNDRFVEITSGLLPGDEVVTRGAYSLSFAGGGSVSLKEALDAAHGHEHAADGSELTPEEGGDGGKAGGDDGHGHGEGGASPLWKYRQRRALRAAARLDSSRSGAVIVRRATASQRHQS